MPSDARVWMWRSARPSRSVIGGRSVAPGPSASPAVGRRPRPRSGQIGKKHRRPLLRRVGDERLERGRIAASVAGDPLAPRALGRDRDARPGGRATRPSGSRRTPTRRRSARRSRSPAAPGPIGSGAGAPKNGDLDPAAGDVAVGDDPDRARRVRSAAGAARARAARRPTIRTPSGPRVSLEPAPGAAGSSTVSIGATNVPAGALGEVQRRQLDRRRGGADEDRRPAGEAPPRPSSGVSTTSRSSRTPGRGSGRARISR